MDVDPHEYKNLCCMNNFNVRNYYYCYWVLFAIYQLKLMVSCFIWQLPMVETGTIKKMGTRYASSILQSNHTLACLFEPLHPRLLWSHWMQS